MIIEKAIELLQKDLDNPGSVDIMDLNQAQALGIEALKRVDAHRATVYREFRILLSGETKE